MKDVSSESYTDLQKTFAQLKLSDPIVSNRMDKSSSFKNKLMAFGKRLEAIQLKLRSK